MLLDIANMIVHALFVFSLGYYLFTGLQWFSYKIKRIIFNFTKQKWHFFYFIIPIIVFYLSGNYFWIYLFFVHLPILFFWYKGLDKPLVFTKRIKRTFLILSFLLFFQYILYFTFKIICVNKMVLTPIILSIILGSLYEKYLFKKYKANAEKKLLSMEELQIIAITASFGKTSIKNFLFEILKRKFKCYKTPRSVNTLYGLVQDVNQSLPSDTKIYIAEAGARQKGDIEEIAEFLMPQIVIVGEVGPQHMEYFKTVENICKTKLELLKSKRLIKAFLHKSSQQKTSENIEIYDNEILNLQSNLEGLEFDMKIKDHIVRFKTSLLGEFNASNLIVCIKIALYLGMDIKEIQDAIFALKNVEHRLFKMEAGGKIIIDDGFNGNLKGMTSSYDLVSKYNGRKVIVTPGIVESTIDDNALLAKKINEIFDIVIISSQLNKEVLVSNLNKPQVIILENKNELQNVLGKMTRAGDLIIFSNDAPSFI